MNIVINTAHQRFGGAVQGVLSFINECKKYPKNDYYIWVGTGVAKSLKKQNFPNNFHFTFFNFSAIKLMDTFAINKTLQEHEKKLKPDVIISTSGPTYFQSSVPQVIGYTLPLYIYPESPYLNELSRGLYSSIR